MFIIECDCGHEIFVSGSDGNMVWQCEQCGKWLNFFGQEVPAPNAKTSAALFQDYDPNFMDDEE